MRLIKRRDLLAETNNERHDMTPADLRIIASVMAHYGITDDPKKRFAACEVNIANAIKTYRLIYRSLADGRS